MELKETIDLRTRENELNRHMETIVPAIMQAIEQSHPIFTQGSFEYVRSIASLLSRLQSRLTLFIL